MSTLKRMLRSNLFPWTLLGIFGTVYAYSTAHLDHLGTVLTLAFLLIVIELFPTRIGKISYTFVFPILYTMAVATGFSATALISATVLGLAQLSSRRTPRAVFLNVVSRVLALLASKASGNAIMVLQPNPPEFWFYVSKIAITTLFFTICSTISVSWYINRLSRTKQNAPTLYRLAVVNILFSVLYLAWMTWIASNPKNTATGDLGLLYFFLPLASFSIMLHLYTNLARAKSGLETLFGVARSINQQTELKAVLTRMIGEATRLVHGSCGLLYLVQEDGSLKREVGTCDPSYVQPRIGKDVGLVGYVAKTGEPLLVQDVQRDARLFAAETEASTRALLLVPIHIDGRVAGVMSLAKKEVHSFHAYELKLLSIFATHAAVAMKNALYMEEREKRLLLEERNRLSREMHDGLAQDLASMLLHIEMLRREAVRSEVNAGLEHLQETLRKTVTTVRHSIYSLRPAPYTHIGLVPALRAHLEEVEAQHHLKTHLHAELTDVPLPPAVARALFAIVTEAIQNAVKHAQASELTVRLEANEERVFLSLCDNGRGFHFGQAILAAAERKSFGIENLYNLADQVGGTLDIHTAPGRGTEVTLEIPLKEGDADEHSRVAL